MNEWVAERDRIAVIRLVAVTIAGVVAGLAALLVDMALVWLAGTSPWAPLRFIAAILMGYWVLPPPDSFALDFFAVGLFIHLTLSIAYASILAFLIHRAAMPQALFIGLVYGGALYFLNFFWLVIVFPWFDMGRNLLTFIAHLVFGVVLALAYQESVRQLERRLA